MYRIEPLQHTADVGYEVGADSLSELFRGAAAGLARTVRAQPEAEDGEGLPDGAGEEAETLTLERPDLDRLLVAWLRELLYRMGAEGRFPAAMDVEMTGPSALRAEVRWAPPGEGGAVGREIKGVTYHGLRVDRGGDGRWHARLVLDV